MIGPIVDKLPTLCSEAEISRCLRARNWNSKKAGKKFKDSIKWRLEYKPERIRWVCMTCYSLILLFYTIQQHHLEGPIAKLQVVYSCIYRKMSLMKQRREKSTERTTLTSAEGLFLSWDLVFRLIVLFLSLESLIWYNVFS